MTTTASTKAELDALAAKIDHVKDVVADLIVQVEAVAAATAAEQDGGK